MSAKKLEIPGFILRVAAYKGMRWGEKLGIDLTAIQANASMKSIVRKDSEKGWKDYAKKLAKKAGLDDPTDAELRQFDRKRDGKKVSNDDWENPNDPDAKSTRMKNGTTRLAYKAEHAVDLESELIVSATVHTGVAADTETVVGTAVDAAANLEDAGIENNRTTIVADKAYHSNSVMKLAADLDFTTVIPERTSPNQRRWTDKNPDTTIAGYNNRRRTKSDYGKLLSRVRSELVERSFAHVCDTGGGRRTWHRWDRKRGKATLDDGRLKESVDAHADPAWNRLPKESAGASRASPTRHDSHRSGLAGFLERCRMDDRVHPPPRTSDQRRVINIPDSENLLGTRAAKPPHPAISSPQPRCPR